MSLFTKFMCLKHLYVSNFSDFSENDYLYVCIYNYAAWSKIDVIIYILYGFYININWLPYMVMIITGAVCISQLLNITHTLQVLDIEGNDIGDEGMAVISEAMQRNKSLTALSIVQCGLSVKGIYCSV